MICLPIIILLTFMRTEKPCQALGWEIRMKQPGNGQLERIVWPHWGSGLPLMGVAGDVRRNAGLINSMGFC